MYTGFLPIGSVVLLAEGRQPLMVIGYCPQYKNSPVRYDYLGCLYPEGFTRLEETFMFNADKVRSIIAVGYQNDEQMNFKQKADAAYAELAKAQSGENA